MARGFESKDVEFQQAQAERLSPKGPGQTPAQRDAAQKRRGVELALAHVRAERDAARHPRHRQMLDAAVAALTGELQRLP